MKQGKNPQRTFWIRDQDSLGHAIDPRLIAAAEKVWKQSQRIVRRYLTEDSEAAEILESAVDAASRAMNADRPIHFFEAYLVRSVAREANRRRKRNQRISYVESPDLERLAGPASADLDQKIDDHQRLAALRNCMTSEVRTMFDLRVLDFDWQLIAGLLGHSTAHSAEVQFRKGIDKALRRFRAQHESPNKSQRPESGD